SWDQAMRKQSAEYSPHRFAAEIEVPLLVIHGDKDYRVPIGQGQELWLDLLTQAKTPLDGDGDTQHRFLYFPDEATGSSAAATPRSGTAPCWPSWTRMCSESMRTGSGHWGEPRRDPLEPARAD